MLIHSTHGLDDDMGGCIDQAWYRGKRIHNVTLYNPKVSCS